MPAYNFWNDRMFPPVQMSRKAISKQFDLPYYFKKWDEKPLLVDGTAICKYYKHFKELKM